MKLLHFPAIRIALGLIPGSVLGFYTHLPIPLLFSLSGIALLLLGIFHFLLKRQAPLPLSILVFAIIFLTGWVNMTLHQEKNHPDHYTKYLGSLSENRITFRVKKELKSNSFYNRYEIKIISINGKTCSGTALLTLQKDSLSPSLETDDTYRVTSSLQSISPPQNPHQFNYKRYLEKQHIYHRLSTRRPLLFPLPEIAPPSLTGRAAVFREKIKAALEKNGFKGDELAVINALLLGQRQDISEDLYNNYTHAGAIHILAVSGLHVGIIVLIFSFLLKPLERLKHGKKLKVFLLIAFLWIFAVIAGLSASVVRAVTMFSFIAWALHMKRTTNIYNILAVSVCLLLLVKPMFLFDVGFQLSYIAVFAIVWIQPALYSLWKPPYKIPDFFWKLLSVTLAAQLGVLPLSLYYFHQFPGLFFVANLVIIPVLGLILGLGIAVIVLALLRALPAFAGDAYLFIIKIMNDFISLIARQEAFLLKNIPFDGPLLLALYALIITGIFTLKKPVFFRVITLLAAVILLQGVCIFNAYRTGNTQQLIVFHKSKNTLIGAQEGSLLTLYANHEDPLEDPMLQRFGTGAKITALTREKIKNVYPFKDRLLFRVDSTGVYAVPGLQPDYVLLCDSPKIHLERLIATLKPGAILADGSNYKSYITRWKATCRQQDIPFYSTGEKGAFILKE